MNLWWLRYSGDPRGPREDLIQAADAVEAEAVGRAFIHVEGFEGARLTFLSVRPAVIAGPEIVKQAASRR